uniref:Uncharacterized protein n=1 Tax=Anopheles christyi TaxID=43041 RepID=A0A182KID8_9DIPT
IHTEQTTRVELFFYRRIDLSVLLAQGVLPLVALAAFLGQHILFAGLLLTLLAERQQIVAFVPLTEGRGIDNDDRVLHQRLGTDQLIVRRVVHDIDDT